MCVCLLINLCEISFQVKCLCCKRNKTKESDLPEDEMREKAKTRENKRNEVTTKQPRLSIKKLSGDVVV